MAPPRVLVLVNPHSSGDLPEDWPALLAGAGVATRIESPASPDATRRLIDACGRARDVDRIALAGGDGTVHQALPALLEARLPFALIPIGTANDLARTLGLPEDPIAAFETVAHGAIRRIDVGMVNGIPFLNAANLGLGVRVNRALDPETKRRWGALSYLRSAWRAVREERPFEVEMTCDGIHERARCVHVAIGNGVFHGGGARVAEDASISDGRLDLYTLPPGGVLSLAALVPWLRRGRQRRWGDVRTLRGQRIEVRTSRTLDVYADGERVSHTPIEAWVLPGALEVLVPADSRAHEAALLRDEREVALNELLAGLQALAASYDRLRAALGAEDPGAAALFADLAQARTQAAARLEGHVRRMDELPAAPDPDRELLAELIALAKGALSADRARALAADRAAAEREIAARAETAGKRDLPADTLALVREIERESQRDRQRLEALAAGPP